jgi:hypothetical protein
LLATWLNYFGEKTVGEIRTRLRLPFVPPPPPKAKAKPTPSNPALDTVKKLLHQYRLHIEANKDNLAFDAEAFLATLRDFRQEYSATAEDPVMTQELDALDNMLHKMMVRNKVRGAVRVKPPPPPPWCPPPPPLVHPSPDFPQAGPMWPHLPPPGGPFGPYPEPRARPPGPPAPINFNHPELLTVRFERSIDVLYDPSSFQCPDTGIRFADKAQYDLHRDLYFAEHEKKRSSNSSRLWFITEEDWVQWTGDVKESVPPAFFSDPENGARGDDAENPAEAENELDFRIAVREVDGDEASICANCHEELKQIFDQEKEEWTFVGVCRRGDGSVVHRSCADEGDSRAPKKQKL